MKNNRNDINKKEIIDFEKLFNTELDNSPKGYYLGNDSACDDYATFIDCSVKAGDFNSVSLGKSGQGKKFRIENYNEDTESLLKSITAKSHQTLIVIDFCKSADNISDGVYIGRVDTDSPVEIIEYIKDDQRYNMPIGTFGEGRAVRYRSLSKEQLELLKNVEE